MTLIVFVVCFNRLSGERREERKRDSSLPKGETSTTTHEESAKGLFHEESAKGLFHEESAKGLFSRASHVTAYM
jgi:hypothetical protein